MNYKDLGTYVQHCKRINKNIWNLSNFWPDTTERGVRLAADGGATSVARSAAGEASAQVTSWRVLLSHSMQIQIIPIYVENSKQHDKTRIFWSKVNNDDQTQRQNINGNGTKMLSKWEKTLPMRCAVYIRIKTSWNGPKITNSYDQIMTLALGASLGEQGWDLVWRPP